MPPEGWWRFAPGGMPDYRDHEALVDAMYAGPKTGLRPIFDQLLKLGMKLGKELPAWCCRSHVSLRR